MCLSPKEQYSALQCCTHLSVEMMLRLQYDQPKEPNDRYKDNLDGQSTTKTANTANTFAQNWRLIVSAVCRTKLIYITISFSVVWSYMGLILHKMTTLIPSAPLQSHGSTYQFQDCNGYKSQDKKSQWKLNHLAIERLPAFSQVSCKGSQDKTEPTASPL